MTIQTAYSPNSYPGDGITSTFPITFPYQLSTDIVVITEVVATGVITTLTLGSDYSVTPTTNSPAGTGSAHLMAGALPVGTNLQISRAVPNTQLTRWIPNDQNPSIAIENAVDKLTMELQQNAYGNIRTWFLRPFDVDGFGMFDARGNRGGNAADPVMAQDFVTLAYMTNYVTQLIQTGFVATPADYQYVADGKTTTFAIPGATVPQATAYYVSEDGLVQRPNSDYVIVLGETPQCIFLTLPPDGVLVSIRVLGFAQPILVGIDGSQIISGRVLPQFLGTGTPSVSTFLRGDGAWSKTLIGPGGAVTVPGSSAVVEDFQNNAGSAIRVSCAAGNNAVYMFGVSGSSTVFDSAWVYSSGSQAIIHENAAGQQMNFFFNNGDVLLSQLVLSIRNATNRVGINNTLPQYDLDVNGTVNANEYIGNADGSLITSGQVLPGFLASNAPSNALFLRGDGIWAIPPGGGGGGGPTTIQVSDAAIASSTMVTMTLAGSLANASGVQVPLYINTISAGTANIRASVGGSGANKPGVITSTNLTDTAWSVSSTVGAVLRDTDGVSAPSWGKIAAANMATTGSASANTYLNGAMAWASIIPSGLNVTNSPTDTFVLSYDLASTHFKWVSNSQLPVGGTGGTFLRGDSTWTNVLDVSLDGSRPSIGFTVAQGDANGNFGLTCYPAANGLLASFIMQKKTSGNWGTPAGVYCNYAFGDGADGGVLSAGAAWTSIDSSNVESFFSNGIARTSSLMRSLNGMWQQMVVVNAPASSTTIDVNTASYQRLTGFANNVTIALADSTPLPSNSAFRYAGHLTLELNSLGSFDITWPGTITWAGAASAPTVANGGLSSSGINIVKLIRRQGQTQWVGYLDNVSSAGGGGSYTDNQARQSVFNTTALPNSATIGWTFSGSPANQTGAAAVVAGSIGNTQLASGILASKIASYPGDGTKYLSGAGTWTVPPGTGGGGGGQASIQFYDESNTAGSFGTVNSVNFVGAGVTVTPLGAGNSLTVTIPGASALTWQSQPSPPAAPANLSTQPATMVIGKGLNASVSGTTTTISATNGFFNVVDYGADSTGATDSTAAFNAAIAAATTSVSTCGTVYIPAGQYKITSTISITKKVNILGDGCAYRGEPLRFNSDIAASQLVWGGASGGTIMRISGGSINPGGFMLQNFGFYGGPNGSIIGGTGLQITACSNASFNNLSFANFLNYGLDMLTSGSTFSVNNCNFGMIYVDVSNSTTCVGIRMDGSVGYDCFGNTFQNVLIIHKHIGVYLGNCDNNTFTYLMVYSDLDTVTRINGLAADLYCTTLCRQNLVTHFAGQAQSINGASVTITYVDPTDQRTPPASGGPFLPAVYVDSTSYLTIFNLDGQPFFPRGLWFYHKGTAAGNIYAMFLDDNFYSPIGGAGSPTNDLYFQSPAVNGGNPLKFSRINYT